MTLEDVPEEALDELYQCSDVRVVNINVVVTTAASAAAAAAAAAAPDAGFNTSDGGNGHSSLAAAAAQVSHVQLDGNKGIKCGFPTCHDKVLKNKVGLKRHVKAAHSDDPRSEEFNFVTESGEDAN